MALNQNQMQATKSLLHSDSSTADYGSLNEVHSHGESIDTRVSSSVQGPNEANGKSVATVQSRTRVFCVIWLANFVSAMGQ